LYALSFAEQLLLNVKINVALSENAANLPNQYSALWWRGLWCMRRHGPVIVHCTDSEDFPIQGHGTQLK